MKRVYSSVLAMFLLFTCKEPAPLSLFILDSKGIPDGSGKIWTNTLVTYDSTYLGITLQHVADRGIYRAVSHNKKNYIVHQLHVCDSLGSTIEFHSKEEFIKFMGARNYFIKSQTQKAAWSTNFTFYRGKIY